MLLRNMLDMNKNTALAIAGVCGTAFIGYCIYFDKKRRSDPDFKKKLHERRKRNAKPASQASKTTFPDLMNVEAVQKFFLEEVQKGEELLASGNIEEGVEHLTNAIAVCGQPQQLLQVLKQTLPPQVFAMLLDKLPTISQRLQTSPTMMAEKKLEPAAATATITDVDDLE